MVASIKKTKEHEIFGPLLKVNKIVAKQRPSDGKSINYFKLSTNIPERKKQKKSLYFYTLHSLWFSSSS